MSDDEGQSTSKQLPGRCNISLTLTQFINKAYNLAPILVTWYNQPMRIIARKRLREFWLQHPDAQASLEAWYADVKQAEWKTPADIKNIYRNASIVASNRAVFNIKGNKYRLVVAVQYEYGIVYIRFIGTHPEYDKIDATTI
jgi:mRNA interferase HigB